VVGNFNFSEADVQLSMNFSFQFEPNRNILDKDKKIVTDSLPLNRFTLENIAFFNMKSGFNHYLHCSFEEGKTAVQYKIFRLADVQLFK
jgi:hypothetical protein